MKYAFAHVAFLLALSPLALAEKSYVCANNESVREVVVSHDLPGMSLPCRVLYKKGGTEETLWSATHDEGYCEEKAAEFVKKLGDMGWICSVQPAAEGAPVESSEYPEAPQTEEAPIEEPAAETPVDERSATDSPE